MTFVNFYIVCGVVSLLLGLSLEWFQNEKGEREINVRDAGVFTILSVIPVINAAFLFFGIVLWIGVLADKWRFEDWFNGLKYKIIFTDKKK